MSEKKTSLDVPLISGVRLEDLRLLKNHENNPMGLRFMNNFGVGVDYFETLTHKDGGKA